MRKVFEESKIGNIKLKNRILRSATHESMADSEGKPTEDLIKKYMELAQGEVGAIITGYTGVMQNGKSPAKNMLMLDKDENITSFKNMVNEIHKYDVPIILQIAHCGRQTSEKVTGKPTVAPSPIRDKIYRGSVPHELTDVAINEIIEAFVNAIERAIKAGFDGVELHLAHGYLLSSFLSPHMNKRKDKWGGSTENRFRIVSEIMKRARQKFKNYPILAKINGYEASKDGIKLEEAIKISKALENSGINAIEVSCGIAEEGFVTIRGKVPFDMILKCDPTMKRIPEFLKPIVKHVGKLIVKSPEPHFLYNLNNAREIKNKVTIPVIVVGGIRKFSDIEDIIAKDCGFVSMSRPFIIQPSIVKTFKEGKEKESRCINCNYCLIGVETNELKCYYGKI
ncbi:NADH:flavin oxidoreductase [Clostridium acetobutylicum]|nr:NADH:flavin oxidoreductase [Clostridium acetobutylicum]